jgi:hypothetical protein
MFQVEICAKRRNYLFLFLLVWLAVLQKYSVIAGQSVTLGWDSSSDPNVLGYNIYYGTASHEYTSKVTAGNGTTVTITGLVEGVTYYFAATTYGAFNQESDFSDEAVYTVPGTPPTTRNFVAGQTLTLDASATSAGQLNYQWQFDSTNVVAGTNAILTLENVTADQAGIYTVTVSDDAGSTTNIAVNVMVYPTAAATLAQPVHASGQCSFTVSGVPDFQYVVQSSSNLVDWVSVTTNVAPFDFTDPAAGQFAQRFYRSISTTNSTSAANASPPDNSENPLPPPIISPPTITGGQYSFKVSGVAGYEYVVESSTNLVNWLPVLINTAPFAFTEAGAGLSAQSYYRVRCVGHISAGLNITATPVSF